MRLAQFIVANFEAILLDWEKFAATLVPNDKKSDHALLRDHVKSVIETIVASLDRPKSAHEQTEKSQGQRTETAQAAAIHGAERHESGFSLNATMAEYRAFRANVIRLWQDAHRSMPFPATANEDVIRFNEAIDQAVIESVASYSAEKDQQARVLETLLSSSPDLCATYDLEGRLKYANKALTSLLECQLQDIEGKDFYALNFPSPACLQGQIAHVIASKELLRGETAFSPPSGPVVLLALLFVDLDRFKEANDRFGHEAGDILLRLVADRLRSCVRKTDTVARLGGDEFTVILNGVADAEHAGLLAGKILKKLARSFHILKNTIHISASIGIALSPLHAGAPEQLIKNADKAMYVAKRLGRNRFNFFLPTKTRSNRRASAFD